MHSFIPSSPVWGHLNTPRRTRACATRRTWNAQLFGRSSRPQPPTDVAAQVAEAERKYGPRSSAELAPQIDAANTVYNRLRGRLLADTAFLSAVWICVAWSLGSVIDAKSAVCGCVAGLGYINLLSPDVTQLQQSGSTILDAGKSNQPLRYLLLPFLVLVIAKSHGNLHVLPAIAGFFSYKVALIVPLITGQAFVDD